VVSDRKPSSLTSFPRIDECIWWKELGASGLLKYVDGRVTDVRVPVNNPVSWLYLFPASRPARRGFEFLIIC
jgi:hypothetical protein